MVSNIGVPFGDLLNPQTASGHTTVPGKMLEIDFGTISAVGQDGLNYIVPAIKGFKISEEMDVPISDVGAYVSGILLPNTITRTGKYMAGGLLKGLSWIITGDSGKLDNYIKEVVDPVFESFTREVILGGAGLSLEQIQEYTGFKPVKTGSGDSPGSSYPGIKMKDLSMDHGRGFGRVLGTSGYEGIKGVRSALEKNFGKEYKTIMSNANFMKGVYEGISEGKKYKGYAAKINKDKFEPPDYYAADDYFYKKAANGL